ncbi:CDGSH iron-sulfur domain-containing protein [Streptomyces tanashiensis]|uniref:CDGSH iron-sulfur domain-containing protein n=1 Tax=Streptomyces tanashiensis TaxID=67367 RepID=UPI003420AA27
MLSGERRRDVPAVPRITPVADGPLLVEGPVEIVLADGTVLRSERPVIALCMCRRSLRAPFCDTSHRRRVRRGGREAGERSTVARVTKGVTKDEEVTKGVTKDEEVTKGYDGVEEGPRRASRTAPAEEALP